MTVVAGHGLVQAGAAFGRSGCRETVCLAYGPQRLTGEKVLAGGHARCECGALSPHLFSQRERKDWHRRHKAAVQAEIEAHAAGQQV